MPFIDFMNPRAVDAYIQTIYQAEFEHFGPEFGRTFKGFFSDEAPVDFTQFTPDFLDRFEKSKGYSIRKWLPSVTHDLSPRDKQDSLRLPRFHPPADRRRSSSAVRGSGAAITAFD